MKEFNIPFCGFYESVHNTILDDAVDGICSDWDTGRENTNLKYYLSDKVNWSMAYDKYARAYAANFVLNYNINGLKFVELDSPREYNFTTDRIFCTCSDAEFERMFQAVKGEALAKVCEANLKSRDGFNSFYDYDYISWGNRNDWDHNQVAQVVEAYAIEQGYLPEFEYDLMESDRCNGSVTDIIEASTPDNVVDRVYNIISYLHKRSLRK